jgi:hypothetical protein
LRFVRQSASIDGQTDGATARPDHHAEARPRTETAMSRDKGRGQAKSKKRAVKRSEAVKDLQPRKGLRAGASPQLTTGDRSRLSANHNETVVRDQ